MGEPQKQVQTRDQLEKGLRRREIRWLLYALLIPGALLALWYLLYACNSYLSSTKLDREAKAFDVLLKVASISALAIGASWSYRVFFRQRLTAARLNLAHTVEPLELSDGGHLIKVYATIHNVGQVAVTLSCWRLSAEQILPMRDPQQRIDRGAFTDKGLPWPSVADGVFTSARDDQPESFWMLLEPGEEDQAAGNLIVPAGIDVVQVYSHFSLLVEEGSQGWEHKILVDLRQAVSTEEIGMSEKGSKGTGGVEIRPASNAYEQKQQHHTPPVRPGGAASGAGTKGGHQTGGGAKK